MTSPIRNQTGPAGVQAPEAEDIQRAVYGESKDLKLADVFAKLIKKSDDTTQASL